MSTETHTKARVGLLVPSSNTVMEQDLIRGLRDVAHVYAARMYLVEATQEAESAMLDTYFPQAVADIATLKPEVTVFGCTSAGALRGPEYDRKLCARIEEQTCGSAVSTIAAVSAAISATQSSRIAVLTPYVDELNTKIRSTLKASNIEVLEIEGFGIRDNFELATPTPDEIRERAVALVRRTEPELLFISCTNFQALSAVPAIEAATQVAVVTSNSAVIAAVRQQLDAGTMKPT